MKISLYSSSGGEYFGNADTYFIDKHTGNLYYWTISRNPRVTKAMRENSGKFLCDYTDYTDCWSKIQKQ